MDSVAHIVLEMGSTFPRFLLDILLHLVNCFLFLVQILYLKFSPFIYF